MRQRLLFLQLFVLCALWVAQMLGVYFYARTPNSAFFSPSHFLGGMWAATFGAWAFGYIGKHLSFSGYLLVALAFGVAWEIYEVVAQLISPDSLAYAIDTIADLMFDVLGGYCAALLVRKLTA